MSQFLSDKFNELCAYVPGEQPQDKSYIKLNTNESPFAPSSKALAQINNNTMESLRLYNDPTSKVLTNAIADYYNVSPRNVVTTNGSDEILAFSFLAYGTGKKTAFADITYGFYSVFSKLYSLETRVVPLTDEFEIDINDYMNLNENVVIANPNAPTGKTISLDEIEKLCIFHKNDIVLIDEAYVDFGGESAVPLIKKHKNLIVVQTFSKSRNLAGARIGFAVADEQIIEDLQRIRNSFNPYNVNKLSQVLGAYSIKDKEYFLQCTNQIIKTRNEFSQNLKNLNFDVLPSKANFVFAKHQKLSGEQIYLKLKENGILVRHFNKPRINDFVRITMGTSDEMDVVINKLQKILE